MHASSLIEQYSANQLNQYESRTVPGKVLVAGEAATNAVVNVRLDENSTAKLANRHGGYFWQVLTADNASALVATTNLQVRAFVSVVQGTTTNSLVRTETRQEIVAQTPEAFAYDADGNLVQDGVFSFAFDGENRLLTADSVSSVPDALKKKLTFAYDFQGRRVRKTVESGYSGGVYAATNVTMFIWNNWLPVAEMGAGFTNFMTWGLDLSGTLQGAGGVSGLAAISLNGAKCFPVFDANGNVMALVTSSGTVVAEYTYGPFGEVIRQTGPQATNNPFRFSTKPTDDETGVVVFQVRLYRPDLAMWLSRDALGETVSPNLTAFVDNDAVDYFDPVGFSKWRDAALAVAGVIYGDDITVSEFMKLIEIKSLGKISSAQDVYSYAVGEYGISKDVQKRLVRNYLRLGTTFENPLKLTAAEMSEVGPHFNMRESTDFMNDLEAAIQTPGATTLSKQYMVPKAYSDLKATLNRFTAKVDVRLFCVSGSISGKPSITWRVDGLFYVSDIYDFNYTETEAQRALTDLVANKRGWSYGGGSAGLYDGSRNIYAELGVFVMYQLGAKFKAQPFDVTSDGIPFIQDQNDKEARLQFK